MEPAAWQKCLERHLRDTPAQLPRYQRLQAALSAALAAEAAQTGVLPGELVRARIYGKRKGVFHADATDILEPSRDRVAPPCGGEKQCTGATWPHIAYPAQLRLKEEILLDTLRRTING